jgi:Fic family protein
VNEPTKGSPTPRGRRERRTWRHDPELYAPARYRRACAYDTWIPAPITGSVVSIPSETAGVISDAEAAIHALNAGYVPALAPLARLLLRTESIASSKVEGMQADARTLAHAEARDATGTPPGRDVAEILANIDAMQLAIEEAASGVLTIKTITDIHRALMEHAPNPQLAGVVRSTQNWIGGNDYNPCGAAFVPPPPELVAALLTDLLTFCEDDGLPPLVQAAIAHAQFETIHPFVDGNGRTGRALVQVLLRRRGLAPRYVPPLSVALASDRDGYIRGLVDFRDGHDAAWIERFATASARSARLAAGYLERVADLQTRWREDLDRSSTPRSDSASRLLIDLLPAHPVITVAIGVAATGRTRPAVAQAFKQLIEAGVIRPLGTSRRNRAYESDGLLDLLADLEAGAGLRLMTDS